MDKELDAYLAEVVRLERENPGLDLAQYRNLLTAGQYRRLFSIVRERLPSQSRVLDWGCGNGHFTYFLVRHGFRPSVFSLDDPPPVLALLGPKEYDFTRGDEREPVALPYGDGIFDAVVSVGVLEHVREFGGDEAASLREIRRILRRGGLFIGYHIPNAWSWVEFLSRLSPARHHHRWRYGRAELRRLAGQAGFQILDLQPYGFLPRKLMERCPAWVGDSAAAARAYSVFDRTLEALLPFLCTNHLCLAQAG
jgi:SAM-dependent methyltransferase